MPSRINMGPDGGPYIAINENNGNIELEDNTGTTVAIWDDANSQWDFQNNPISNVDSLTSNSVNTGDATITDATVSNFTDSPTGTYGKTIAAPTPTAYFSGPAHGEGGNAFRGATLAPDGRVVFAPTNSSNVGIFDPSDDSYVSGPAHGEGGGAFIGATLALDGRVVFAPFDSSNVGIVSQLLDIATANSANR